MAEEKKEKKTYKEIPSRHMMATVADYGDGKPVRLETPDLCIIYGEDGKNYVGRWVTGFGFDRLRFPKATTRPLTEAEKKLWESKVLFINDTPIGKIGIKEAK